jgi:hypothetical protein
MEDREFGDLDKYRAMLIGKTIKTVRFSDRGDEGLEITLEDGHVLEFAFSGCEGMIFIT